jgi:hypothetical protein
LQKKHPEKTQGALMQLLRVSVILPAVSCLPVSSSFPPVSPASAASVEEAPAFVPPEADFLAGSARRREADFPDGCWAEWRADDSPAGSAQSLEVDFLAGCWAEPRVAGSLAGLAQSPEADFLACSVEPRADDSPADWAGCLAAPRADDSPADWAGCSAARVGDSPADLAGCSAVPRVADSPADWAGCSAVPRVGDCPADWAGCSAAPRVAGFPVDPDDSAPLQAGDSRADRDDSAARPPPDVRSEQADCSADYPADSPERLEQAVQGGQHWAGSPADVPWSVSLVFLVALPLLLNVFPQQPPDAGSPFLA